MQCRNEPNVFHEIQQTFCWGNESDDWSWKEELVWADEGATHLPNGSQFGGKVFAYVDPKFDKKCIPALLRSEDILWESWLNIQVPSPDIQPGHVWYFLRCSVFCLAWALHWGSQCESQCDMNVYLEATHSGSSKWPNFKCENRLYCLHFGSMVYIHTFVLVWVQNPLQKN